jgi:hypothetical protein
MKYQSNQSLYMQLNLCSFTIIFISFMHSVFSWKYGENGFLSATDFLKTGVPYAVKAFLMTLGEWLFVH